MTCLALVSIEPDTSLRPIATVYNGELEGECARSDHRLKLSEGRLVALLTLTGEAAEIAERVYSEALDNLFAHPWSEPLEATEYGRAYIAAQDRLHTYLTSLGLHTT